MTNKDILATMFVPRSNGLEGVCFRSEYMDEANAVQQAVSSAQYESGLSHDFSYRVGKIACDILSDEQVDWNDDDAITEAIDSAVPVYTHELMEIYKADSNAVDEACEELGDVDNDSSKRATIGWYIAIQNMV